mmetsp:Transcript_7880/g.21509  ORF Transcript_7880/g.21509 Transcript_7880/m.21509 type:complete len:221 (+) Transcript_7880:129-791(+)
MSPSTVGVGHCCHAAATAPAAIISSGVIIIPSVVDDGDCRWRWRGWRLGRSRRRGRWRRDVLARVLHRLRERGRAVEEAAVLLARSCRPCAPGCPSLRCVLEAEAALHDGSVGAAPAAEETPCDARGARLERIRVPRVEPRLEGLCGCHPPRLLREPRVAARGAVRVAGGAEEARETSRGSRGALLRLAAGVRVRGGRVHCFGELRRERLSRRRGRVGDG